MSMGPVLCQEVVLHLLLLLSPSACSLSLVHIGGKASFLVCIRTDHLFIVVPLNNSAYGMACIGAGVAAAPGLADLRLVGQVAFTGSCSVMVRPWQAAYAYPHCCTLVQGTLSQWQDQLIKLMLAILLSPSHEACKRVSELTGEAAHVFASDLRILQTQFMHSVVIALWPTTWREPGQEQCLPWLTAVGMQVEVQAHIRPAQQNNNASHWQNLGSSHFWEVVHSRHSSSKVQLPPIRLDTKRERAVCVQAAAERWGRLAAQCLTCITWSCMRPSRCVLRMSKADMQA